MKNCDMLDKLKEIENMVRKAEYSNTWAQCEAYVSYTRELVDKLQTILLTEDANEQVVGKNVFLESYNTDLETELDDIWKHLAMLNSRR